MMNFGTLRFIRPSLESSWRILAHSNPKTDPKMHTKMYPKWIQNQTSICFIFGPFFKHFLTFWGDHFGVKSLGAKYPVTQKVCFYHWKTTFFCKNDMIFM